jgi:hypothetical protein
MLESILREICTHVAVARGHTGPPTDGPGAHVDLRPYPDGVSLVELLRQVDGRPVRETAVAACDPRHAVWSRYAELTAPETITRERARLVAEIAGRGGEHATHLRALLDLVRGPEGTPEDVLGLETVAPDVLSQWRRGIVTRREADVRARVEIARVLNAVLPPGAHLFNDLGTMFLARSEDRAPAGEHPVVGLTHVAGATPSMGWTRLGTRRLSHECEESPPIHVHLDLVEALAHLMAGTWPTILADRAGRRWGEHLAARCGGDRDALAARLREALLARILDHEVGHNLPPARSVAGLFAWPDDDVPPTAFLVARAIAEELHAESRAVVNARQVHDDGVRDAQLFLAAFQHAAARLPVGGLRAAVVERHDGFAVQSSVFLLAHVAPDPAKVLEEAMARILVAGRDAADEDALWHELAEVVAAARDGIARRFSEHVERHVPR